MSIRTDSVHTAVPPTAPEGDRLRVNKLDLLERLADDLAHEIKNPLHSMVINLEVLKRRAARLSGAEELHRYTEVIAAEMERLNRRIELLLRLTRPGRGPESATLADLVDELLELLQLEVRHHECSLDYVPPEDPPRVALPREVGRQIILNVVLEALESGGPGARLRMVLDDAGGEARLELTRSGGQPPDAEPPAAGERLAVARVLAESVGGRLGSASGGHTLFLPVAAG